MASLTFAATAFADGRVKLTGPIKEDPAAKVKLVVVKDAGAPKAVKNIRIKNLLTNCEKGEARIELDLTGAAKLNSKRKFHMTYVDGKSKVVLDGKVREDSRRVVGDISGSTVRVRGAGDCRIPNVSFTAKK